MKTRYVVEVDEDAQRMTITKNGHNVFEGDAGGSTAIFSAKPSDGVFAKLFSECHDQVEHSVASLREDEKATGDVPPGLLEDVAAFFSTD